VTAGVLELRVDLRRAGGGLIIRRRSRTNANRINGEVTGDDVHPPRIGKRRIRGDRSWRDERTNSLPLNVLPCFPDYNVAKAVRDGAFVHKGARNANGT